VELVIEVYADGSRMVVVDKSQYYVREYKVVRLNMVGDTMDRVPVRAYFFQCEEVESGD
jgi:hypothetical protein